MRLQAFALLAAIALGGCANVPTERDIEIRFGARVGDAEFRCGQSYAGIGTTNARITPTDFRFYVSDVELIDAAGRTVKLQLAQDGVWQFRDLALLDFEDGSGPCRGGTTGLNARVVGKAPPGDYRGLSFTLGVPFALNHGDPTVAPSPLNLTAMFWSWQVGYKFVKVDFTSASAVPAAMAAHAGGGHGGGGHGGAQAGASGWSLHLGSTQCASAGATQPPSQCANPNRLRVTLANFDPARSVVVTDLRSVLAGANVDVNAPNTSPGCMSFPNDPDCMPVMPALGLAYGSAPAQPQRFFRTEAR